MRLSVGTKSLLYGAHWPPHALAVALSWRWLYGKWPSLKQAAAIGLHDVGYLGCRDMDGDEGVRHPELGARIADAILGREYGDLVRGHSQGYANLVGVPLSRLYAADKLAIALEVSWLYLARTRATGELAQYRTQNRGRPRKDTGASDDLWFRVVRARMVRGAMQYAVSELAPDGLGASRGR